MCGRAAQTVHASYAAARSLGISPPATKAKEEAGNDEGEADGSSSTSYRGDRDNYNMSPGMDAAVIWEEVGQLKMDRKVYVYVD